jgi:hypothetical protein
VSLIRYGFRNRVYAKKGRLVLDSELYQDQSFNSDLSVAGDRTSSYSPVFFVLRFWPSRTWSGELRLRYSILTDRVDSQSFSLQYRPRKGESEDFVRVTYLKTGQTTVSAISDYTGGPASEEIRLAGSFRIWKDRLTITPILERDLKNDIWRNRRLILWYHGSCYAIGIEAGKRTIGDFHDTQYRFLIRLKGAGTVVDFYGGTGTYVQ